MMVHRITLGVLIILVGASLGGCQRNRPVQAPVLSPVTASESSLTQPIQSSTPIILTLTSTHTKIVPTNTYTPEPSRTDTPVVLNPILTPALAVYPMFTDENGVAMAPIPQGEFLMGSSLTREADLSERPQHTVYLDAFYIDIYEVTNAMYSLCIQSGACTPPHEVSSYDREHYFGLVDFANYPVVKVDWEQAMTFCKWRGAELPTEAQWEKAARGALSGKEYPWGDAMVDCSLANAAGCVLDTTPVGSYPPNGFGVYDMAGNVSEWIRDWYDEEYYSSRSVWSNPLGPSSGSHRMLRGGSWYDGPWPIRAAYRDYNLLGDWYFNWGFRCSRLAASMDLASVPVMAQMSVLLTQTASFQTPVVTLTPTPEPLPVITEIQDDQGAEMIFIPAGDFTMGSAIQSEEKPPHSVFLDAFFIDKYEVTNAQYKVCVQSGSCTPPHERKSGQRSSYYNNSSFAEYPVIYVDWEQAKTYCEWRGGRLPTEAEWEKAARGVDGRKYPWGNQAPDCALANYGSDELLADACVGDSSAVGSYPQGASPYGVLDMAGNVWEWVQDWFRDDYYSSMDTWFNPPGPDSGESRGLRGGGYTSERVTLRASYRGFMFPEITDEVIGFRCVRVP